MKMLNRLISMNIRLSTYFDQMIPCLGTSKGYKTELVSFINAFLCGYSNCQVLEVGGIDRPLLCRSEKVRYDGLDVDSNERCYDIYDNFHKQSVEETIVDRYDLIISKGVLEHVRNNKAGVVQMYRALNEGGCMVHYLPSKYHPYSILLSLIGSKWQRRMIGLLRPWAANRTGYPAFFDECSPWAMRKLVEGSGFEHVEIIPFFSASDYFRFCFPVYVAIGLWDYVCRKLTLDQLCSGFIVIARK
jgi:SAM-dependent methyltransferase